VLFKFRTGIILLRLCAHTHLEVNFNFLDTTSSCATVRTSLWRRPDTLKCLEGLVVVAIQTTELHSEFYTNLDF
jgi:hypothetical protein